MNIFKDWMRRASTAEQERLAEAAGTTRGMLYQYSNSTSTGRLPSAERAGEIEAASAVLHRETLGKLPLLYRTDLCKACRGCEYARAALGEEIMAREEAEAS